MALGLLNLAMAEWKGDIGNVASWNDAIKAMGVSEPMECASQSHPGSVRDPLSVQSKTYGKCTEPMECAEPKPWEVYGTHGVCRAKAMGSVRNPWSVRSKSHGKCAEPMKCAEQKPWRCAQPMECAEPKPWSAEPHRVCKARAT